MRSTWISALAAAVLVSGCAALTSGINKDNTVAEGVAYNLPRSVLTIAVWQYYDEATSRTWYTIGGVTEDTAPNATIKFKPASKITDETIPDPGFRYAIKYNPSASSDDRFCISRSATGLLHDVEFASDDRTPEIAFNIARFVAGSAPKKASLFGSSNTSTALRTQVFSSRLDPFDEDSVAAFNEGLKYAYGPNLKLDFKRGAEQIARSPTAIKTSCTGQKGKCIPTPKDLETVCKSDHICYRTKVALPLDLKLNDKTIDTNYAEVINIHDVGAVSVTRAMLVHKISKFRFDSGTLLAAIVRKPSEIEEASLLPIHIINAALITPSGMWAAAFNQTSDKKAILEDMKALTTAVKDLDTQVKEIVKQGGGPEFDANTVKYQLDCAGPKRTANGSWVNIINNTEPTY